MTRKEELQKEIAFWKKASADCPHCEWGCYCDGDWSPESNLDRLEEELYLLEKEFGGEE